MGVSLYRGPRNNDCFLPGFSCKHMYVCIYIYIYIYIYRRATQRLNGVLCAFHIFIRNIAHSLILDFTGAAQQPTTRARGAA